MKPKTRGILYMCIGAICFSAKAIFIKLAYQKFNVDYLTLLSLRFGLALPIFVVIGFYRAKKAQFKQIASRDWWLIAALSLLGYYIASLFDFMGLQYITAGLERIILFTYPTMVVMFSSLFLKKEIGKTAAIALGITYLGITIIAFDPHIFESENFLKGSALIMVSAVTYALYLVFGGEQIIKYGSINFNVIAMVFSSVYVLIHFYAVSTDSLFNLPQNLYLYGLALAIISTVIPTFLVMEGIKLLGANLGAIVASIGPASTILMGYLFLGETLSIQEFVGSVLVLLGVLLVGKK